MGLETSTYISGLTSSWPPSGDPKSQGDDHLRLIKGVLQATFPNATKPLYIPKCETVTSGPMVLDATDQNNLIQISTTSGDVAVTLPAGFTTTENGWSCEIFKNSGDGNAIIVSPASGSINSQIGATATIRVGTYCLPAKFIWTGTGWLCVKPGPIVGSTFNWDGPTIPLGCLALNGTAFSGTAFAELALALGTTTLREKRGRVEAGVDEYGYFTGIMGTTLGSIGGAASVALAIGNVPFHNHNGTSDGESADHTHLSFGGYGSTVYVGTSVGLLAGGTFNPTVVTGAVLVGPSTGGRSAGHTHTFTTSGNPSGLGSAAHNNLQPTIITQKLIRAC